jgi:subtilisin family serine protease
MSIDIAIIDSGINPWHSHVQGVSGGISLQLDVRGEVKENKDFRDELGHGTAIAGIIRESTPRAGLYAVKIFHQTLESPAPLLLAALKWAIIKRVKIIHLSLGTEQQAYRKDLKLLCREAYEKDIVIVAAARTMNDRVFPASFDEVIGVYWNHNCIKGSLYYCSDSTVEFGAYGRPRALDGMPQELNFAGSSFAAAHVTAMAADILEQNPRAGVVWVKNKLQEKAKGGQHRNGEK